MKTKNIVALLLILMLGLTFFASCQNDTADVSSAVSDAGVSDETSIEEKPEKIRIAGLKGPTSMGLVKVIKDDSAGATANDYEFTVAGSADEITPKLVQGEFDIAAVPVNLASVLYNKTGGKIKLLAVNTLGVLYITEKGDSVSSVADLKGKTIYATGKGSTPEYNLRYILSQNGIDPDADVTIEWKTQPDEVVAILAGAESGIAMLPQPYVTVAKGKVEGLRVAIDLNEEWKKLQNDSMLITGVLVVREEFAAKYPEAVKAFLSEYKASIEYVNANVKEASVLVEEAGIVKAAVAEKAIPQCNIVYIAGEEMKAPVNGYLEVLFAEKTESVGGKLPEADFFYDAE